MLHSGLLYMYMSTNIVSVTPIPHTSFKIHLRKSKKLGHPTQHILLHLMHDVDDLNLL